jgi:hypothetical protein
MLTIDIYKKDGNIEGEPSIHDCLALFNEPEQLD